MIPSLPFSKKSPSQVISESIIKLLSLGYKLHYSNKLSAKKEICKNGSLKNACWVCQHMPILKISQQIFPARTKIYYEVDERLPKVSLNICCFCYFAFSKYFSLSIYYTHTLMRWVTKRAKQSPRQNMLLITTTIFCLVIFVAWNKNMKCAIDKHVIRRPHNLDIKVNLFLISRL